MRWLAIAGIIAFGAAMLATADTHCAAKAASSHTMYQVEQIVGTVLSSQRMYEAEGIAWYSGELRLDEPGNSGRKAGEVLSVRYPLPTSAPGSGPAVGDQVRAKMREQPGEKAAEVWIAASTPEVLGRGELLRPGEGGATDLGSPGAKILVKMFAPVDTECHQKTAKLLRDRAAKEPERVRVQIFDMRTAAGREEMRRERLTCATVLVNNRYRFVLEGPTGKREVSLHHRPNEPVSSYHSEDVIAVIEQELKRCYQ